MVKGTQPEGGRVQARLIVLNREGEQRFSQRQEFFRPEAHQRGREFGQGWVFNMVGHKRKL